ncbi:hypothetical protein IW261DRAFT_1572264 [Armillaria novae-zelandiae]|uniref:Uncharacterized protein n=1 Tax=Armillaria novae-zelandiae TaxID=153914 RepID=A0AA39NTJ7_9AGAR|nr:hypothetical protein IW261DRAFT_1572264 [Armillaria novae-zelandiae]
MPSPLREWQDQLSPISLSHIRTMKDCPKSSHMFLDVTGYVNTNYQHVCRYGNTLEGKRFSDMWTHHEQGKSVQEQHSSWLDRLAKQTHQLLPVTHEEPDCVPDNDTIDSSPAVSPPALTDTPVKSCLSAQS